MSTRAHIFFPPETLEELDRAASQDRRTRSATVQIAVEQYLAQRSSVTGPSRLAQLERLANSNIGANMSDPDDVNPMPPSLGDETSSGAPAFGGPYGKITIDPTVNAINSGTRQPVSAAAHDANRAHLADHLAGGKWGGK